MNLGIELGPNPPIKINSPGSYLIKVVDSRPCRVEANIGVTHDLTHLHHPFMVDNKKHYGFKLGLLGQDGSLTKNLLKLIDIDPFLGYRIDSPATPIKLGKVRMNGARSEEAHV